MNNSIYFQINSKEGQYEEERSSMAELVSSDGLTFNAHSCLLAKHSIFLRHGLCLFKNSKSSFVIPNVRGAILEQVLYFINYERVLINQENFTELMIAADYLQIDELSRNLKTFSELLLSVENCLKIFIVSMKISDKRLYQLSYRIIQMNFYSLLHRYEADLTDIPREILKAILSDNSLRIVGENVIWDFILKWVSIDTFNRLNEVCGFLKCLKVGHIEESLATEIINSDIISKNPYCENIKNIAFQKSHSNLDALKYIIDPCSESPAMSTSNFYSHRIPTCLHLVFCNPWFEDGPEVDHIYVSYDEKVDTWRKLGEIDIRVRYNALHVVGNNIYAFDECMNCHVFSLYENPIPKGTFKIGNWFRNQWSAAAKNKILLITDWRNDTALKFELYDTETGLMSDATPMYPVSLFEVISFQDKIFVVGNAPNLRMLAQTYEADSNSWSIIFAPNIYRSYFYLTVYHGKLYIYHGVDADDERINAVEVFDNQSNKWSIIDDLPFDFEDPLLSIDREDSVEADEQYVLNETRTQSEPTSMKYVYVKLVHTITDKKLIQALVKESRHPSTSFIKIPFHSKFL